MLVNDVLHLGSGFFTFCFLFLLIQLNRTAIICTVHRVRQFNENLRLGINLPRFTQGVYQTPQHRQRTAAQRIADRAQIHRRQHRIRLIGLGEIHIQFFEIVFRNFPLRGEITLVMVGLQRIHSSIPTRHAARLFFRVIPLTVAQPLQHLLALLFKRRDDVAQFCTESGLAQRKPPLQIRNDFPDGMETVIGAICRKAHPGKGARSFRFKPKGFRLLCPDH